MIEREALDAINRSLPLPGRRRHAIERELAAHLAEARRELTLTGLSPEEAARESVARLGNPSEIAEAFGRVYRPSRVTRVGLAFGLASALLLGMYTANGTMASARAAHHPTPQPYVVVKHATRRAHG